MPPCCERQRSLLPPEVQVEILSIAEIPLFNEDIESGAGIPDAVAGIKDRIAVADGLMIATPEYNNGMPGVLKNAIDWLSRPPGDIDRVFGGKPVVTMGASLGAFGTVMSQAAWLPVLRALRMRPWFGHRSPHVGLARSVFGGDGSPHEHRDTRATRRFHGGVRILCRRLRRRLTCPSSHPRRSLHPRHALSPPLPPDRRRALQTVAQCSGSIRQPLAIGAAPGTPARSGMGGLPGA